MSVLECDTAAYNLTVTAIDPEGLAVASYLTLNINVLNCIPVIFSTTVEISEDISPGYMIVGNFSTDPENYILQYNITGMWPDEGPFGIWNNGVHIFVLPFSLFYLYCLLPVIRNYKMF